MRTSAIRSRGSSWRAALVALAVLGATMATTVVTAAPAQARCDGVNREITMVLRNAADVAIARERAVSGTCDGDRIYRGEVQDSIDDNSCAELHMAHVKGGDTFDVIPACITGAWVRFSVSEPDGRLWFGLHAAGRQVGRDNFGF